MTQHCHLLVFRDIHGVRSNALTSIQLEKPITNTLGSPSSMRNLHREIVVHITIISQQYWTGYALMIQKNKLKVMFLT